MLSDSGVPPSTPDDRAADMARRLALGPQEFIGGRGLGTKKVGVPTVNRALQRGTQVRPDEAPVNQSSQVKE